MGRMSISAMRTLAGFGLTVRDVGCDAGAAALREARAGVLAARLDDALGRGRVGVVIGPSGAGKSTVVRAMACAARVRGERVVSVRMPGTESGRRVVDALAGDLDSRLRVLSLCGMGDARLAVTPVAVLSDGERARLGLARAMVRCADAPAHTSALLVADEFGAALDSVTARAVARGLRKFVLARQNVRAVVATTREEVLSELGPAPSVVGRLGSGWIHEG